MLNKIRKRLKRHAKDEAGVTSVEFVISATAFMFILFWTIETGFIMVRWVMLERGVDVAARSLRISGLPEDLKDANGDVPNQVAHDYIKGLICDQTTLIDKCDEVLFLELQSYDSGASTGTTSDVKCVDRQGTVDPATDLPSVTAGERNVADKKDMMYMRACVVVDPILPASFAMPLPLDDSGGVALIVDSAYVNEPG